MKKIMMTALMAIFAISAYAQGHWTNNPHDYANTMTVVGVIQINDAEIPRESMEVGAFCGMECRGSVSLRYFPQVDRHLAYLTVSGVNGDEIAFCLYDAETETELEALAPSVLFVNDTMLGRAGNPYVFTFTTEVDEVPVVAEVIAESGAGGSVEGFGSYLYGDECTLVAMADPGSWFHYWTERVNRDFVVVSTDSVYTFVVTGQRDLVAYFSNVPPATSSQTLTLAPGWNWVSSFVTYQPQTLEEIEEVIAAKCGEATIKSQTNYVSYEGDQWLGAMPPLDNTNFFMVLVDQPMSLTLTGSRVNPTEHPVELMPGWNWIGYMLSRPMPLSEALSNLQPEQSDMIKSPFGYPTYNAVSGQWTGVLQTLEPGQGYMYLSTSTQVKSFVFP